MYDLFSVRDTIARNITNAPLVNPQCAESKRIAFEIGNAFDRLVTRPGYRRTSVAKTRDFPAQRPNKYKCFANTRRVTQMDTLFREADNTIEVVD